MKKQIVWSILLLLIMWMSTCGGNIQIFLDAGYDYDTATSSAMYYGTIGTLILTLIMIAIPAICVIFQKGKLRFEKGLKLCKWNSIILFIISIILTIFFMENNYTDSFFGIGGLGALMFYFINKWLFVANENEERENHTNIINAGVTNTDADAAVLSQSICKNNSKKKSLFLPILLFIALIISVTLNITTVLKLKESNNKISLLEKENSEYNEALEELSDLYSEEVIDNLTNDIKIEFYDENIVFVIDGYGNYYYTYDQMEQVTQGIDEYSYWAYNKEQAISLGYKKWK